MKFIGREKELKELNNFIKQDNFGAGLIYGRRRIGKSELIKELIRKSEFKTIYYECKQTSEEQNVKNINSIFSEVLNIPPLDIHNIEDFFEYLFKNLIKEKIIIVLDEYPYLRECVVGCDSIFQTLIDNYKDILNVKIFFLGSYIDTMKALTKRENPLYGRIDLNMFLKPMNYYDSAKFYPNFKNEDKVIIYSVFGGIPYYNSLINDNLSVKENIINLISSNNSRLINEVPDYLEKEIGKLINANEVFSAIAKGYTKFNDILTHSNVSSSPALSDTLNSLIKMDLIEKISPINDKNNKKKSGYYIKDNFSCFYYKYIFPYSSQLALLDPNIFFNKYIEKDFLEQYVPKKFELICKEYLIKENYNGNIKPFFFEIGKYYYDCPKEHKNGEFDIVTLDDIGYIFYEVKFKNKAIDNTLILKEIEQVKNCGLYCYKYAFISKSGFENQNLDNVIYLNLDDIYH